MQDSKLHQAATELGEALAIDEEFLEMVYSKQVKVDLATKLEETKQQLLTEQGNVKTSPRIVIELLEKVMILQSLNAQSTYSTAETLRHFQGKIDKQRWEDTPPNIAGYLFGQLWAAIIYSVITIVLLIIAYVPAANYCQQRESAFCTGIQNIRTYVLGEDKK